MKRSRFWKVQRRETAR